MSKAARTDQPINSLSPMRLIERRHTSTNEDRENVRDMLSGMIGARATLEG
jgi:ribosomal protein L30/L7E